MWLSVVVVVVVVVVAAAAAAAAAVMAILARSHSESGSMNTVRHSYSSFSWGSADFNGL